MCNRQISFTKEGKRNVRSNFGLISCFFLLLPVTTRACTTKYFYLYIYIVQVLKHSLLSKISLKNSFPGAINVTKIVSQKS